MPCKKLKNQQPRFHYDVTLGELFPNVIGAQDIWISIWDAMRTDSFITPLPQGPCVR